MTVQFYDGSVFECFELNDIDMIVNTVNCKGFMGAGLALEFKLRYPKSFEDYSKKCELSLINVGKVDVFNSDNIKILNFPTKDDWKKPSKLEWIEKGLKDFSENYKKYEIKSIAFPKLGTKNGGLNWNFVEKTMFNYLSKLDELNIYICLDRQVLPESIEGKMLEQLNNAREEELKSLKIRQGTIEALLENTPYSRFFEVSKVKGLGKTTYEKLHRYYYTNSINKKTVHNENDEQLSLF